MRTTVSGYALHHLVHRGPGCEVWLGQDPDRSRLVAIKRRSVPEVRSGGRPSTGEGEVLAALDHPNVVALVEVLDDPPDQVLALTWVPGGSLRDLLDERGTLLPGELVALLLGVAAAIEHLDAHEMVHGDLRPDHVVLNEDGSPVLVGFGSVARVAAPPAVLPGAASMLDAPGRAGDGLHDPTYRHPAVAASGRPDARSEVFSLAVMAYECLTGRVPHRGTPAEVLALAAAGVHRPLSSWPSVPSGVADAVEAALMADGPRPIPDAGEFVARLRDAVEPAAVVLPLPRPRHRPPATGLASDETLPFGPRPSVVGASTPPDTWRVAAAVVIATVVVAGLWFLAGAALAI